MRKEILVLITAFSLGSAIGANVVAYDNSKKCGIVKSILAEKEYIKEAQNYKVRYEVILKLFNELYAAHADILLNPKVKALPYRISTTYRNDENGVSHIKYVIDKQVAPKASYFTYYADSMHEDGWREIDTFWMRYNPELVFNTREEAEEFIRGIEK